jgi:hypothetical protein
MIERDDFEEPQGVDYEREAENEWSYKESIAREEYLEVRDSISHLELKRETAVYINTVAALRAGVPQVSSTGKLYLITPDMRENMNELEIKLEAEIMASKVVG